MSTGFVGRKPQLHRRAVYGPGSGRELGYYATDSEGRQFAQDTEGRRVARILRWKDGKAPFTDSHPCGGTFLPAVYG